jgi:putative ABC transport system ATP-binding protein
MGLIELQGITKTYRMGALEVPALAGVNLTIDAGEYLAIMGPSGSGKTTLMNILGLLDTPTTGSYRLDGEQVSGLSERRLAQVRAQRIGFVFQSFNLLPRVSAVENVELSLIYAGSSERRKRAERALDVVGLGHRRRHRPNELSGGEQQRVAIARALANEPTILLADEPTGNLDSRTSREVMELFGQLNRDDGITIILVTHDAEVARHARRTIAVRDGRVICDTTELSRALDALHSHPEDSHCHLEVPRSHMEALHSEKGSNR